MAGRHFAVHGHFYQPPRENPWTETVPVEPSAAPFHDWNERIAAECYRPNAFARIVDDRGRVLAIVNDYALLSFNIGPTLASWLETHQPDAYARILAADAEAGTGIAQAYNHMILPLASPRDLRTQVRWGLADFRYRFGRAAEGIWLPETAVNDEVLAVLVEEGVRFTILAPGQAAGRLEPGQAYYWEHPDGLGRIALVFYDGALSHDVAFGLATRSAAELVDRAQHAPGGGLVLVATDGETFGHHHKFTERTVAYALAVEAPRRGLATGTVAAWLAANPPTEPMAVHESAWSCAHGVGRWREDCGCSTGGPPGWDQRWRAPLRAALDLLREHAAAVFERVGGAVLHDPWAARDAYVDVVLDPTTIDEFLAKHARPGADVTLALTLLEAQRHAMLMYTSCGWFFYDLAGLETVQVLRYAARCLDLLREAGDDPPEDAFLAQLAEAHSNDGAEGDGATIWRHHVLPARVTPRRVVAHIALLELLDGRAPEPVVAGWNVHVDQHAYAERGQLGLSIGRVTLVHRRTRRLASYVYAALHLGALDVVGACRPARDPLVDAELVADLGAAFEGGHRLTSLLRLIEDGFGPGEFDVSAALPDAPGRLLETAARSLAERFRADLGRLVADHRAEFTALRAAGYQLPPELRAPAQLALAQRLEADLESLALGYRLALRSAEAVVDEAGDMGVTLAEPSVRAAANRAITALVRRAVELGSSDDVDVAVRLLDVLRRGGIGTDVEVAQEAVYDALLRAPTPDGDLERLGAALGLSARPLGVPR